MIYHVTVEGRAFEIDVGPEGIRVDGRSVDARIFRGDASPVHALHVDRSTRPLLARRVAKGRWRLRLHGTGVEAHVVDDRTKAILDLAGAGAGPAGPTPVVAPMPGLVLRVEVEEGDQVAAGQGIVIVEAMKMENELRATGAGTVARVLVREGEAVEKDQVLVELDVPDVEL